MFRCFIVVNAPCSNWVRRHASSPTWSYDSVETLRQVWPGLYRSYRRRSAPHSLPTSKVRITDTLVVFVVRVWLQNYRFDRSSQYKKAQLTLTNPRDSKGCKNCSNSTCFVSFHRIPFPQISNYQCIASRGMFSHDDDDDDFSFTSLCHITDD